MALKSASWSFGTAVSAFLQVLIRVEVRLETGPSRMLRNAIKLLAMKLRQATPDSSSLSGAGRLSNQHNLRPIHLVSRS